MFPALQNDMEIKPTLRFLRLLDAVRKLVNDPHGVTVTPPRKTKTFRNG